MDKKKRAMSSNPLIDKAIDFAKRIFQDDSSGHDFFHTLRVFRLASRIAEREGADGEIVRLAALLHDADDRKLFGATTGRPENARRFMTENGCAGETVETVCRIISEISFKGTDTVVPESLEGKIVQDADRLDAVGAVGIARAFAFGGSRGRSLYDPDEPPKEKMTAEEYFAHRGTTVNHFYEKLLKLKDLMNTETAKKMAARRHRVMEDFLAEFFAEWNGEG